MIRKKTMGFTFTLIMVLSVLSVWIPKTNAALPMTNSPEWYWDANIGDVIAYKVSDNLHGERYYGLQVQSSGSVDIGGGNFADILNFSILAWDEGTGNMVPSNNWLIEYTRADTFPKIWGLMGSINLLFIASPIIPRNFTAPNDLNLTHFGEIMTAYMGGSFYGGLLMLDSFRVNGLELQLYNSTHGYFCNMTYFSNGTLQEAKISLLINSPQGPLILNQTIEFETDMSKVNPMDDTDFSVNIGDSLIYKRGNEILGWEFVSYNITSINYPLSEIAITRAQIRGNEYHWSQLILDWEIDESNIGLGGGNDFNHFQGLMNGPFNIIYPEGSSGEDLNQTYFPLYSNPTYGGFEDSIVTAYSCKIYNNSNGAFIYLELNPNGILINGTYNANSQMQSWLLTDISEVPTENLIDETTWGVEVGDKIFYSIEDDSDIDFGRFEITCIKPELYYDMGAPTPAIVVMGNFTNWSAPDFIEAPHPVGHESNELNLGVQNDEKVIMTSGPWNIIFAIGTTGELVNNSFSPIFKYYLQFTEFVFTTNSWSGRDLIEDEWYNITWGIDGVITELSMNLTDPGMNHLEVNMTRISASDLPGNLLPIADFTVESEDLTITLVSTTVNGDLPLYYIWDLGDGTVIEGIGQATITHTYAAAGDYTVKLTVIDYNGDESEKTDIVTVQVSEPEDNDTDNNDTDNDSDDDSNERPTVDGFNLALLIPFTVIAILALIIKRKNR